MLNKAKKSDQAGAGIFTLLIVILFSSLLGAGATWGIVDLKNDQKTANNLSTAANDTANKAEIDQLKMDITSLKATVAEKLALAKGDEGDKGDSGDSGPSGPQGEQGDKGATGATGATGAAGATGATGATGSSGTANCPNGSCVSLQSSTPGIQETGSINVSGTIKAASLSGSGINVTQVDAASLQGNTSSYFANASNLTSGTLSADRIASGSLGYTKLSLGGSVVNADISTTAAIAYSKLNLSTSVVNADIAAGAAIAYSKLNLAGSVTNADLVGSIADSKLSTISTAGKVSDSALSANVALLNGTGPQTFTGNNAFTGTILHQNATDSTTAFRIQDASGVNIFRIDTTGTGTVTVSPTDSSYNDEFNSGGPTADPKWTYSEPGGSAASYTVNSGAAGKLRITSTTSNHDCWVPNGDENCLRLFQTPPSGDFQMETKIDTTPVATDQAPGLMVWQDANNYLRFEYELDGGLNYRAHKVIGGAGTANLITACAASSASVYLRVTRSANTWTYAYSTDGFSFTTCGSFSQALTLGGAGTGIGPSYNSAAVAAISIDFDYFRASVPDSGTFKTTTTNLFQNAADSTTSLRVQNAAGTTILGVDTVNARIFSTVANGATAIGFALNTPSYTTSGAKLLSVQNNTSEKFAIDKDGRIVTALVPQVRVYPSGTQSINDSTLTKLNFDTERFDTDTLHDTVTNNTRLTASAAGKYLIYGTVTFATNTTGIRELAIQLNNSAYILDDIRAPITGFNSFVSVSGVYQLAAGDYVEAVVYQTSTGSLSTALNANRAPEFGMSYIGP